jgi:hypothetical protein
MSAQGKAAPFITARVAIGLVVVSALSLLAFLILSAYAPELRSEKSGGNDALSKSAVGFAGLRYLLDNTGNEVEIGRRPPLPSTYSLVILTPDAYGEEAEIAHLATPGARLIVLPKWMVFSDPKHPGWVTTFGANLPGVTSRLLSTIAPDSKIKQAKGAGKVQFHGVFPRFQPVADGHIAQIDTLQTISGKNLEADIVDEHGNAVLAQVKGTQTYVLADPDLLNNQGLHDAGTARMAVDLITLLRNSERPVSFDVTLNGIRSSPDLLRAVFSPPFLGATLCVILAALFIAYHAFNRFGAAARQDRVYAFGKRALADNTAAVIRMMHREPAMAPRYAQATLNLVAAHVGLPRERTQDAAWVQALEKSRGAEGQFAELNAEAAGVRDTGALLRVAAKLYKWRRGILHGHR